MSVFHNNMLVGASQPSGVTFDTTLVPNSIFFDGRDTSGDTMTRTSTTPDNRNRWLFGTWYHPLRQPLEVADRHTIFAVQSSAPTSCGFALTHEENGDIRLFHRDEDQTEGAVVTSGFYRDTTSWYHILVDFDSANFNAEDRISLFINGERVGAETGNSVGQNKCVFVNTEGEVERIGSNGSTTPDNHISAYLAQTFLMDNKSIANGDHATTDFLDTFTFGTNGSQVIPKSNDDIKALVAAAGPNSFYLNYEDTTDKGSVDGMTRDRKATESTNHVSGITPTLSESIQGGALVNVTNGQRSRGALETTGTALTLLFDLGSGNEQAVQSVSFTTEGFTDFNRDPGQGNTTSQTNGRIKDLTISGSNNGTDFTTLSSSTVAQKRSNALHVVSWSNTTAYRYLKFANANIHGGLRSNVGGLGFHTEQSPVIGNDFWGNKGHSTSQGASEIDQTNQSVHTPSKVYAVWNDLRNFASSAVTLGDGNLKMSGGDGPIFATKAIPSTGKWVVTGVVGAGDFNLGIATESVGNSKLGSATSSNGLSFALVDTGANLLSRTNNTDTNSTSALSAGDKVIAAFDADTGELWLGSDTGSGYTYLGGGNPETGATPTFTISSTETLYFAGGAAGTLTCDFGQNGFDGTVPSGFESLNSTTLTAPDFQGIDYFDSTIYEGTGNGFKVGDFVPFTDVYNVTRSAMFNDGDSRILKRTFGGSGDRRTMTFSTWFKWSNPAGAGQQIFGSGTALTDRFEIQLATADNINIFSKVSNSTVLNLGFDTDFTNIGEWVNLVVSIDTDQSSTAERYRVFVDGVQQTLSSTTDSVLDSGDGSADSGDLLHLNSGVQHNIGGRASGITSAYWDGYFAETVFIDGSRLDASSFGQLDTSTNRWVPKDVSGLTFGTNGFYLEYKGVFGGFSQIDNRSSTVSGNMTNGGGLSAIFDGDTVKSNSEVAQGANTNDNDSFVVVDHGEAKTVSKFIAFGSTDAEGLDGDSGGGTITFTLRGSTDNFSSSDVQLFQGTATEPSGTGLRSHEVNSGITSGAFQFHKMIVQTNTTNSGEKFGQLAQLQYFETGATNAGTDTSGNGNNFTEEGTFELSDQVADAPTKNYAVYDTVQGFVHTEMAFEDGRLTTKTGNGSVALARSFPIREGYWYYEVNMVEDVDNMVFGLYNQGTTVTASDTNPSLMGIRNSGILSVIQDGGASNSVGLSISDTGLVNPSAGDIIGIYIRKVRNLYGMWFSLNGTAMENTPAATATATADISFGTDLDLVPAVHYSNAGTKEAKTNFGQLLNFAKMPTSFNSDSDGYWRHAPVSGFKALNQDNLDNTSDKITAWAWIKNRDADDSHILVDRVRGVGKVVHTDNTTVESAEPNTVQRFLQRGVHVGNDVQVNTYNESKVLWQWLVGRSATTTTIDASSTTPTNSLASTVAAADAGHFSVVGFTGSSGAARTIAHGMGGAPEMMIFMNREQNGANRTIYHKEIGATNYILFTTAAKPGSGNINYFNNTEPDATVFTVGSGATPDTNGNGQGMIVYCFRSVPGVCKVGSYVGNASTDGPYVSTGFKPVFLMTKTLSSGAWGILDAAREPLNPVIKRLFPNANSTEDEDGEQLDFLSDGFKLRKAGGFNNSGQTYIYMAMAEIGGNGTLPPVYGK